jgi:hypothetical protein
VIVKKYLGLFLIGMVVTSGAMARPSNVAKGFEPLFNGKNLDGWWGARTENPAKWMALPPDQLKAKQEKSLADIQKHWRVKNRVLVNDGKGLFLTTYKYYGDFELVLEYKTEALGDSGVYLRGIPQVQIWDHTEKGKFKLGADKGSGGLWNNRKGMPGKDPLVMADKPFGQWNKLRIIMVGERVSVQLNGKLVVDHARMDNYFNRKEPIPRTGPIQLQTHGKPIAWRNVYLREIKSAEANKILAAKTWKDGEKIFNGKDFTGWKGAVANYEVIDGTLRCKAKKGGTLFTEKEYSDFSVQFEFKLPPGGNNGLAIRYPGKGDTAYVGMCELQVLDNTAAKYKKLDDRQFHGSVYGQVAAHRGYLRPVGEWNFQTVDVIGSKIKVELNGTVILDADVSTVSEFKGNRKHPGKDRTKGYFGFAGHSDPVAFRNVMIKEIK